MPLSKRSALTKLVESIQDVHNFPSTLPNNNNQCFLKNIRFIGRENEIQILMNAYKHTALSQRSSLVLIYGDPGAGKSTLVQAFIDKLPNTVLFADGSFDRLKNHSPYSALVAAFDILCRQIIRMNNWEEIGKNIKDALGSEVNVLERLFPSLSGIASDEGKGEYDIFEFKGVGGSYTRFKQLFRSFLRCVASKDHPVIFFLDDLHWADIESLDVLKSIVTDNSVHNVMVLCTYRKNTISHDDLLKYNLIHIDSPEDEKHTEGWILTSPLLLENFCKEDMNKLLSSMLSMDAIKTRSLSKLIWSKTEGNPFYALHFLDMLHREGILVLKSDNGWEWDEELILSETNVAENVSSILEAKLLQLPDHVRTVLQVASFMGHEFSVNTLGLIFFEEQDLFDSDYTFCLQPQEVILTRISEALHWAFEDGLVEKLPHSRLFKFAHSKIRKVLYEDLMPDHVERLLLHQRIGARIWESIKKAAEDVETDDHLIFQAANNLNLALSVVDYSGDRYEMITLNLLAAKRSRVKCAFTTASDYLRVALNLLEGDASWHAHYDLCISLYTTAAETFLINNNYDESMNLVNELHRRSSTMEHKYITFDIQMSILSGQGNLKDAISLGLEVIRKLGVPLPYKITLSSCCKEYLRCKLKLGRRSLHSLLDLPMMENNKIESSMKFMDSVLRNALYLGDSHKEIYIFMTATMFRLSLRFGLSSVFAPLPFLYWGIIHAAMEKYDVASDACNVAFAAIERFKADAIRGRATIVAYAIIRFWRIELNHHHSEAILQSYHHSMSSGETFFAHMGILGYIVTRTHLDKSLSDITAFLKITVSEMREENAKASLRFILPFCQLISNLAGDPLNIDPSQLQGSYIDQAFDDDVHSIDSNYVSFRLNHCKMVLGYLFGNFDIVVRALKYFKRYGLIMARTLPLYFCQFWNSWCHYEMFLQSRQIMHRQQGRSAQKKVEMLARTGTVVYAAPNLLLIAMEKLCDGKSMMNDIEKSFMTAISACADVGCWFFQAVATERLAKCYLQNSNELEKGMSYLQDAINLYRKWGAFTKVESLTNAWPTITYGAI